MKYYSPKDLDEALQLLNDLQDEKVTILAGGTDVVPKKNCAPEKSGWITHDNNRLTEEHIIFLGNLGLDYIKKEDNLIRIGACATFSDLLRNPVIKEKLPVLQETISNIAGLTIRNIATIGGNVMNASPAADSIPPLMAMDTQLVLISKDGERTVPMTGFFKSPGKTEIKANEILKELVVPIYAGKAKFIKFGRRKAETLSLVNGSSRLVTDKGTCTEARLILGAVAPTPLRLTTIEEMLVGKSITNELIQKAADEAAEIISPIDDKRTTASYRKKLVKVLVRRVLESTCQ